MAKQILEFLSKHPRVEISFSEMALLDSYVLLVIHDRFKFKLFRYYLGKDVLDNDSVLKEIFDKAEEEMYGDKEETQ